jgi:hypothetical protein
LVEAAEVEAAEVESAEVESAEVESAEVESGKSNRQRGCYRLVAGHPAVTEVR